MPFVKSPRWPPSFPLPRLGAGRGRASHARCAAARDRRRCDRAPSCQAPRSRLFRKMRAPVRRSPPRPATPAWPRSADSSPGVTPSPRSSAASTRGEVTNVRLRAGDNKQEIELALTGFEDTVEVGRDAQSAAADPNGGSLSTQLTPEEIEALAGRSERSDPPAGRNGRRERGGPRRWLQRRHAALARRDPFDPHRPRHVSRREPFRRKRRHRHHHAGRRRSRFAAASRRACATASSAATIRSSM